MARQSKKTKKGKGFNWAIKLTSLEWKILSGILFALLLYIAYYITFGDNVKIHSEKYYLYIPRQENPEKFADYLSEKDIIGSQWTFDLMAGWMDLDPKNIQGLYEIQSDWSNYQLINALHSNIPIPSQSVKIPAVRLRKKMIEEISQDLKFDKEKFQQALKDSAFLANHELNKELVYSIFIPGTYYVPKSVKETELIEILHNELLHFFNDERISRAHDLNLTPEEVVILASIVYSETKVKEEMPLIAGVYINRLKSKMKLEADPTLVYASGNFNARRVYKSKKLLFPAYNTYENKGLPPGPIHFPPTEVIDKVLNYEDHNYYYFCADPDSTGCHVFAATFEEHKQNADKFRKHLDSRKIY